MPEVCALNLCTLLSAQGISVPHPHFCGGKGSRHPGRQAEVVLREMAVGAPF